MMKQLPNLLTLSNLLCGVLAMNSSMHGYFDVAGVFILLAAAFDAVDGRAARRVGNASEFGKELDSLADIVSFGAAPMIILLGTAGNGYLKFFVAAVFLSCAAIRLARFNSTQSNLKYFVGIPVPLAALLSLLARFTVNSNFVYYIIVLSLGILMISNVRLPNFKNLESTEE
ncbi:CDP-diacylglycerol--serine O-phosphatidyltransferase [Vagococcus coleopterorum]|uniref:CDP-diacylglycerol--serine O-phosphatidyltransferase n=2 Tax=Vagococcus coleopterorum TaxID=2714946 RepID=A0A6G8AP68_9ENTE|nr:CDP-diacylglycerol--serine O-phosphatidyltransferase [Vagococcus coleopterorum]